MHTHRALSIPEVLRRVLHYTSFDSGAFKPPQDALSRRERSRSLRNLALTCKFFSALAPEYLWQFLDSLAPLLKTLPQHLWKLEKRQETRHDSHRLVMCLTGEPGSTDWAQAQIFGRYVRVYDDNTKGYDMDSNDILPVDVHASFFDYLALSKPFELPNLVYFRSETHAFVNKNVGAKFFTSNLRVLRSDVVVEDDGLPDLLHSSCPNLETLDVYTQTSSRIFESKISELLFESDHLKDVRLQLENLTDDTISRISQHHFERLSLHNSKTVHNHPHPFPPVSFAFLTQFAFDAFHPASFVSFLKTSQFPRLKRLEIEWRSSLEQEVESFATAIRALLAACSPEHLEELIIGVPKGGTSIDIEPTVLRPLLSFAQLINLSISFCCSLEDAFVKDLSLALFKLKDLRILPVDRPFATTRSYVSLQGLVYIIDNCPDLLSLVVPISINAGNVPVWHGEGNPNMSGKVIICSTISRDYESAANLLRKLFPNSRRTSHMCLGEDGHSTKCDARLRNFICAGSGIPYYDSDADSIDSEDEEAIRRARYKMGRNQHRRGTVWLRGWRRGV